MADEPKVEPKPGEAPGETGPAPVDPKPSDEEVIVKRLSIIQEGDEQDETEIDFEK